METFAPGDRVVAINTNIGTVPLKSLKPHDANPFLFPDGPVRGDVIYHVHRVCYTRDGCQGVYLTGLRVTWGDIEAPWCATRFRKVDDLRDHAPKKRRRKQPVAAGRRAICSVF